MRKLFISIEFQTDRVPSCRVSNRSGNHAFSLGVVFRLNIYCTLTHFLLLCAHPPLSQFSMPGAVDRALVLAMVPLVMATTLRGVPGQHEQQGAPARKINEVCMPTSAIAGHVAAG